LTMSRRFSWLKPKKQGQARGRFGNVRVRRSLTLPGQVGRVSVLANPFVRDGCTQSCQPTPESHVGFKRTPLARRGCTLRSVMQPGAARTFGSAHASSMGHDVGPAYLVPSTIPYTPRSPAGRHRERPDVQRPSGAMPPAGARVRGRCARATEMPALRALKDGWLAGDRTAHSLYLEFSVDRRTTNTVASAKPGFVMTAEAGLFAAPNRAYAQVLTNGAYSDGSVLFRGLRLPEVASAAQSYPILKKVEITYGFIRDGWSESVAQGFSLHLTFGDSTRDDRRGKRLYFTAASGLDALQHWQGRLLQKQFEPQDTVGEYRAWGSNEWKQTD
jgi:hypothetical protein